MSEIRHFDTSFIEMLCACAREFVWLLWFDVLGFWCFVVCLRLSARSAGDIGASIECSCVLFSRRYRRLRRRIQHGCIISQRKTGCLKLRLFCCFGICLRKSARSAGDIEIPVCGLIEYSCVLFSRRLRRSRRRMQQAALSRRERQIVWGKGCFVVLWFVCVNQRDQRENRPFHLC